MLFHGIAMGKYYCCAKHCNNNSGKNPNLTFHRFPKDEERCSKWLKHCRKDLQNRSTKYLNLNRRLCSDHFTESQKFQYTNKLVWNAIPTEFEVTSSPKRKLLKRSKPQNGLENDSQLNTITAKAKTMNCASLVDHSYCYIPDRDGSEVNNNVETINSEINSRSVAVQCESTSNKPSLTEVMKSTVTSSQLRRKSTQRVKLYRLRQKVKHLKRASLVKSNDSVKDIVRAAGKYLKGPALEFFESQLSISQRKKSRQRYTKNDKQVALALHHQNPIAYKFLKKMFVLPHYHSLRKWSQVTKMNPGLNEEKTPIVSEVDPNVNKLE
ncbi:uncharacterized protein LOC117100935 [Anneissia japonica]|uniref:uncharacterized protein LOC117100935 n=1 Tax=Anneissia japonica TaxID=1529436 RepID=UPI0014258EA5|nr:uncharacterized protein LOC117100935 [Anneissia japonica]